MTAERSELGRKARRVGNRWRDACIRALREAGWPGAEAVGSGHRGDITGCGDVGVECKDEGDWRNLADHIRQARDDAYRRDLPTYVVWRKRRGVSDPMEGYCVQQARDFWTDRERFEELERIESEYSRLLKRIRAQQLLFDREET